MVLRSQLKRLFCAGVVAAGLWTPPALAMCMGGGSFMVYEIDVLSCQAATPRLDQVLKAEKLATPKKVPGSPAGQTDEERAAAVEPAGQHWDFAKFLAARATELRRKSERMVLLKARAIRQRRFDKDPRRDASARGTWEKPESVLPQEMLLNDSQVADCASLLKGKVFIVNDMPCCDTLPSSQLACAIDLVQSKLAPPELVGNQP